MKKILFIVCYLHALAGIGQKFSTEKSKVTFFSDAAIEDISATNSKSVAMFNVENGEIAFSIPIKDFTFEKKLMQEHFNEKYMDTEKYPKSTFQGTVSGFQTGTSGAQEARAKGKLTIHGVTRDVDVPGTVEFSGEQILIKSKFIVQLEDYNVTRPKLLWKNIAEQVEVTVDFTLKPYEK